MTIAPSFMSRRFRGFLPVVIDLETGGFDCATDALLEVAAIPIEADADGTLRPGAALHFHVQAFCGAKLHPASLAVNGIDPHHPLRPALAEQDALQRIFRFVRHAMRAQGCRRAILVGHNAAFDLGFLNAAVSRGAIRRSPFHPFSSFDTASLAGAALGQTVLARACAVSGIDWDPQSAHSAVYDAQRTAEIFCRICNSLHASFMAAQNRAAALGWHGASDETESETEEELAPASNPAAGTFIRP